MSTHSLPPIASGTPDDDVVAAQVIREAAPRRPSDENTDDVVTASIAPPPERPPRPPRSESVVTAEPAPAEVSSDQSTRQPARRPFHQLSTPRKILRSYLDTCDFIGMVFEVVLGACSLMVILAVLATVPVLNILCLGYLLEASGRVARTGKFSRGFVGLRKAYRVGSYIVGTWLMLLPLRFLSDVWYQSSLIDPTSGATFAWRIALIVFTVVIVAHILLSWYSGGRLRHFFWPIWLPLQMFHGLLVSIDSEVVVHNQWPPPVLLLQGIWKGHMYAAARDEVWNFVTGLRLPHYFWLGLRGFAGALAWLFMPVSLLLIAANLNEAGGALLGFFGSVMLAYVVLYLPFLQTHFAAENRFRALFEWWEVRMQFRRAPLAFWTALLVTLLFALPLYLLKIEVTPAEVTWLPALVFVAFIFPARLITGWALGRARRRETPRHILTRWFARLGAVPVVLTYVFFVYLSQYLSWYGTYSFLDQHAFLVPVPFLGI